MKKLKKMKTRRVKSLDRISALPNNIIEHILTLMPIRDATRTSVLSTKWRYSWRSMPKLVFNNKMVEAHSDGSPLLKKYKIANAIFNVLLLHNGPTILEFYSDQLQMGSECDLIITHLSRGNSVKDVTLKIDNTYQLPASFFSLKGLETIMLQNGVFELPSTFNGFSCLKSMTWLNVKVSAHMLQRFLSKCPLIDRLGLGRFDEDIHFVTGGNKFTFVDLLQCVPLISSLEVTKYYVKWLCVGSMPHKLPGSLAHLEYLYLHLCLMEQDEISSALCIIKSSTVLEKIIIAMYDNEKLPVKQTPTNFLGLEYHSDLKLDHLETLEIKWFTNLPIEREFVKLIMAKAPVLKIVIIELDDDFSDREEVKMLRDLVLHPFPRASPSAKLIIKRLEAE